MPVAVKEFNNLSTAEAVRHEALVMSKCCHPSLPHLFGINVMKKPYVLVSYFYGIHDTSCTLHRALHSGSISLTYLSAMNILLKVCQAVEHLHSKQFLHRDIKSNNIVLTKVNSDYHPLLIDFGKAISVSEAPLRSSLSIRRFWGKGEKWKRKRKRGEGKKRLTQMLLLEPSTLTQHDSIPSNQNHFRSLGCQLYVSKSSPEINLT